jgi:hypothetical protein
MEEAPQQVRARSFYATRLNNVQPAARYTVQVAEEGMFTRSKMRKMEPTPYRVMLFHLQIH